ncbi:hypothetical protein Moror_2650 [Moniliophthora roreri MCA 2997]|uniref:Fungal pheromone mating factor STE2 GPCR-domain-containing protein n=1 Tax=Moniliophthora roreri (strain MCA 2997) TaxID=1381753 RepID=V2WXB3_MONRO|nr:hypothetical protein Moror_2650 [Moniliophthora roreri MCA 2997]
MSQLSSTLSLLFFTGWSQIMLYGFNAVLFGVSIVLLQHRKGMNGAGFLFLFISTIFLFIFVTISAMTTTVLLYGEIRQLSSVLMQDAEGTGGINLRDCTILIYVSLQLVDLTTFIVLAYRCYNIWNHDWRPIVLPSLMILAETVIYYIEVPILLKTPFGGGMDRQTNAETLRLTRDFTAAVAVLNIIANGTLTLLIAGKIWWSRKKIKSFVRQERNAGLRKYNQVIATTLESGLIAPAYLVVLGVYSIRADSQWNVLVSTLAPQVLAMAPLLITVRAGLGISIENTKSQASGTTLSSDDHTASRQTAHRISRPRVDSDADIEMNAVKRQGL